MSDWWPIETAPKDGQLIIVYELPQIAGDSIIEIAWWTGSRWLGRWGTVSPSHWMPLLQPPIPTNSLTTRILYEQSV